LIRGADGGEKLERPTYSNPRRSMPQILIVTDRPERTDSAVVYRERITLSDLESDHFSAQLVERVGWAMLDAEEIEHDEPEVAEHRLSWAG
jgi:hypothetical protein